MIYLDSSVALAHLLAEDRRPQAELWERLLVSSRLLEYEIWNRINRRKPGAAHQRNARALINRVDLIELSPQALKRALQPFPSHVRTLDAIHLASMVFLRERGQTIELASYDERFVQAARALGFELVTL
jgi:predicted nucleic acid-binding protein